MGQIPRAILTKLDGQSQRKFEYVAYGDVSSDEDNEIISTVRSQRSYHPSELLARC